MIQLKVDNTAAVTSLRPASLSDVDMVSLAINSMALDEVLRLTTNDFGGLPLC